jgi:hypothetical protein
MFIIDIVRSCILDTPHYNHHPHPFLLSCFLLPTPEPRSRHPTIPSFLSLSALLHEAPTASGLLLASYPQLFFRASTNSTYFVCAVAVVVPASTSFCQAFCFALPCYYFALAWMSCSYLCMRKRSCTLNDVWASAWVCGGVGVRDTWCLVGRGWEEGSGMYLQIKHARCRCFRNILAVSDFEEGV